MRLSLAGVFCFHETPNCCTCGHDVTAPFPMCPRFSRPDQGWRCPSMDGGWLDQQPAEDPLIAQLGRLHGFPDRDWRQARVGSVGHRAEWRTESFCDGWLRAYRQSCHEATEFMHAKATGVTDLVCGSSSERACMKRFNAEVSVSMAGDRGQPGDVGHPRPRSALVGRCGNNGTVTHENLRLFVLD